MPSSRVNFLSRPFLPTHPQVHSQARDHLLFLPAPFCSSEKPVSQGHHSGCLVCAVAFVGVLNRVRGDPPFRVKGKHEHSGKLVSLVEVEYGFVPAQQLAQPTVDPCTGVGGCRRGGGRI